MARGLSDRVRACSRRGCSAPQPSLSGHASASCGLVCQVNEGLMAIFFFVVGLEIKQEITLPEP